MSTIDFDISGYSLFERQSKFYNGYKCVYCLGDTTLIESKDYYQSGIDYGLLFICRKCDAYVGCHKGTDKSLGTVASKPLREARHNLHLVFDPLWMHKKKLTGRSVKYVRGKAYGWLAKILNLEPEAAHIGNLNLVQCKIMMDECKKYLKPF